LINIIGTLNYIPKDNVKPPTEDDAHTILRQILNDSVYGTFAELPPFWKNKFKRPLNQLANELRIDAAGDTKVKRKGYTRRRICPS
jgi:hypothetical protein